MFGNIQQMPLASFINFFFFIISFSCCWLVHCSHITSTKFLHFIFFAIYLFSSYWFVHYSHVTSTGFLHFIFLLLSCILVVNCSLSTHTCTKFLHFTSLLLHCFLIIGLFINHTCLQAPIFVNCYNVLCNVFCLVFFGNLMFLNLNITNCDQIGPSHFQHDTLIIFFTQN